MKEAQPDVTLQTIRLVAEPVKIELPAAREIHLKDDCDVTATSLLASEQER